MMMDDLKLYEVLVPTIMNGVPVKTKYHKLWDQKIIALVGGISILHPLLGKWKSSTESVVNERMILCRIACKPAQVHEIIEITKKHYNQEAVMMYKISDEVIIA